MFELIILISLACSGVIVYLIRKKRAENRRKQNQFAPTRQKDIKKAKKKARREQDI